MARKAGYGSTGRTEQQESGVTHMTRSVPLLPVPVGGRYRANSVLLGPKRSSLFLPERTRHRSDDATLAGDSLP